MKIVMDTGVLVSGVLSPHGAPAAILRALLAGRASLCYDERIMSRYRDALTGSTSGLDADDVGEVLAFLEAAGERVLGEPSKFELEAPDTAAFVEVAAAGQADFLVAGGVEDFPEDIHSRCQVVTARALMERLV